MKSFINNLLAASRKFTIVDFAVLKISLICIGILIGVYFDLYIAPLIVMVWFVGGISLALLITKIVNYYDSGNDK